MGAVVSVLLRFTRLALTPGARANRAALLRQARAVLDHYNTVTQSLDLPPLPSNSEIVLDLNRVFERWARINVNYYECGTEHEMNFSIFNHQNQQILSGILYTDTTFGPNLQVAIHFTNPNNGESYRVNFVLPVDIQDLYNLFF